MGRNLTIFPVIFLLAILFSLHTAVADIEISNCSDLDQEGTTYLLIADIIDYTYIQDGYCDGIATSCGDITDSGVCGTQLGCLWDEENQLCQDNPYATVCGDITNPTDCGTQDGCLWHPANNPYCMNIQAGDITLDCQGHTIDGIRSASSAGIQDDSTEGINNNITIKNCILTDWETADIIWENNSKIINSTFSNNVYTSIYGTLYNSEIINSIFNDNGDVSIYFIGDGNQIINVTSSNNVAYGLSMVGSNNQIINSTFNNDATGIYLYSGSNNTFYGNRIQNNIDTGISFGNDVGADSPNIIYNNILNNSIKIFIEGAGSNFWNTTQQVGTRIYSSGTDIGGNYWTNSSGTGYSDTCLDANTDGFCDSPFDLLTMALCTIGVDCGSNVDYLSLSNQYSEAPSIWWDGWNVTGWGTPKTPTYPFGDGNATADLYQNTVDYWYMMNNESLSDTFNVTFSFNATTCESGTQKYVGFSNTTTELTFFSDLEFSFCCGCLEDSANIYRSATKGTYGDQITLWSESSDSYINQFQNITFYKNSTGWFFYKNNEYLVSDTTDWGNVWYEGIGMYEGRGGGAGSHLSINYTNLGEVAPYLIVTFNYSSVEFGLLSAGSNDNPAPDQLDGVYNVSVDSSGNYAINASGTDFSSGSSGFEDFYLAMDTNSTAGDLSIDFAESLGNEINKTIDTYTSSDKVNFFGWWLSIPTGQEAGEYSSTATITIFNV